jgi:receptor protein-tyrosine kinase
VSTIERAARRLEEQGEPRLAPADVSRAQDGVVAHGSVAHTRVDAVSMNAPFAAPKRLSVTPRAVIDLVRLARSGCVTPDDPRSPVAEEFRVIKRPVIRNAMGKSAAPIRNGNLIMVTSALPGEGKSTTSVNLAMSIAMELDNTVLLIDADVAKPSIPELLGITPSRGLLDLLSDGGVEIGELLVSTNVEKFNVLNAGGPHPRATELLASDVMGRLLNEMANRYSDRVIVFDSPPLLLSNEARVLATQMGQVIVVVEAESTTHSTLMQALATVEQCPVKLLLLNKSRMRGSDSYGSYGAYGSYGYGAQK